ncbi:glucose-6-phosphate dehydrogenase assembly protein OpcA, partial [Phytoactinopolyspora endophytica]|uniref:glucose-6-phosphate dehydrogenase assembly protein OpcA n=1 Tax=Phytoactinopolyspora endophytica TaxID=1642495 RepID=UPI001F111802
MIIDLPKTTSSDVGKRLVDLREKHGAVALGRVLTLVLITDEDNAESAIASANHASHEHPCRIVAVIKGTSRGSARLDAQIRVGGDAGASEVIVLRTFGPLTAHPVSVV